MIPHNWKSTVGKMAAPDAANYLRHVLVNVESALAENDVDRARAARLTLGLSPQRTRVALILYDRRGMIVHHERLMAALQSEDSQGQMDLLRVVVCRIRHAIRSRGGCIINHFGIGYEMRCPDIPELERTDP